MALDPKVPMVKDDSCREGHPGYYGKGVNITPRSQGTKPHHRKSAKIGNRRKAANKFGKRRKGRK